MEAAYIGDYPAGMSRRSRNNPEPSPEPTPVPEPPAPYTRAGELMGQALRLLRRRHARTQETFCERTGVNQSSLSEAENAITGWDTVNNWSAAVGRAGGDPLDLIRFAAALSEPDPQVRELVSLWAEAEPSTREGILGLLRGHVALRRATR